MEINENSQYLTVDDLAAILKVSKTKIYGLTRESGANSIPRIKLGKYIRFKFEDVLEWLEKYRKGYRH